MIQKMKIDLVVPHPIRNDRYFTLRLKQHLENERDVYQHANRIFVVSDIEGNFQAFCKLLIKAGVIDKSLRWIFGDNHLVIAGDCFDRGNEVTECLWLIYSLEEKAKSRGGHVHFILGNHEIMNMNGDWRYIHPKYAVRQSRGVSALYEGNNELWRWLCTKNIIEKIGNILFVHAGIAIELVQMKLSVSDINSLARPYYTRANESFSDPALALIFGNDTSPFWYRGYYLGTSSEEQVNATLSYFNVKTIVTGHTLIGQVDSFFNGKVINVNTDHAGGNSEGLMIKKEKFYRIAIKGKTEKIM